MSKWNGGSAADGGIGDGRRHHHVCPDVKLVALDQQRLRQVLRHPELKFSTPAHANTQAGMLIWDPGGHRLDNPRELLELVPGQRSPEPQVKISTWLLCMSLCADLEFRVRTVLRASQADRRDKKGSRRAGQGRQGRQGGRQAGRARTVRLSSRPA